MTATQVQFRRGTQAQNDAVTFPEGEAVIDLTNDRWRIHDGVLQGGFHVPNHNDARNQTFNRGTVGGTGNAITITLYPVATGYAAGMTIKFIAAASNTGAVTINIDGLGTRNIQKISSGSLQNLVAGDLVSGGVYEITYDGAQFQLLTLTNSGLSSVSQGDLNTSIGSGSIGANTNSVIIVRGAATSNTYLTSLGTLTVSGGASGSSTYVTLPGGEFGFFPQTRATVGTGSQYQYQQRYITSSPPFDLGDGEVGGFFFALVNSAGEIQSSYIADVPPWAYNGPTNICASHKCTVTGKKFRRVMKKRTFEEVMDGAPIQYKMEEITHRIKNADMSLIPHPFEIVPDGCHVVLLDPMDDKVRRIIEYQNAGGDFADGLSKIIVGDSCKRKCPKGVHVHKLKYKYTGKF